MPEKGKEQGYPAVEDLFEYLSTSITDETVRERKIREVKKCLQPALAGRKLPGFGAGDVRVQAVAAAAKGMSEASFVEWYTALLPSDRALGAKLIENTRYIDETELKATMLARLKGFMNSADGENMVWLGMGRTYVPHHVHEFGKTWYPSYVTVMDWYKEYLQAQGFLPVVRTGELDDRNGHYSRYYDRQMYYGLANGDRRILLLSLPEYALDVWKAQDFLGPNAVAAIGDDWALGDTPQSSFADRIKSTYQLSRYLARNERPVHLLYGYATSRANRQIADMLMKIQITDQVAIPHMTDPQSGVSHLDETFDESDIANIYYMSPDVRITPSQNDDFFIARERKKVLVHSAISFPDNCPNVMRYGPWPTITEASVVHHPRKQVM